MHNIPVFDFTKNNPLVAVLRVWSERPENKYYYDTNEKVLVTYGGCMLEYFVLLPKMIIEFKN